jgi:hypothetical protein
VKNNPFLKVFGILKTFSQKGLKRVKGRALAHPLPDKSKFEKIVTYDAASSRIIYMPLCGGM